MAGSWLSVAVGLLLAVGSTNHSLADTTVYAAASTTEAVNEIGTAFAAKKLGTIVASFDSSSTLAKQIENGARPGCSCRPTSNGWTISTRKN